MTGFWAHLEVVLGEVLQPLRLWNVVLRAPYPAACKTLALRSLSNWVTVYNKWQLGFFGVPAGGN